jgi:WD40 repeat protein
LAFNQTDLLAIHSDDNVISIVNVTTRSLVQDLRDHSFGITCIAFSPNNLLASGSVNGTIHVWETESWSLVEKLEIEFGHADSVAFSPNGFLAAGMADIGVLVWNTETWESSYWFEQEGEEGGYMNVLFNGNRLISAIRNRVFIWKERTGSFN